MNIGVNGHIGVEKLDGDFRDRRGDEVLLYCKLYVREGPLMWHTSIVTPKPFIIMSSLTANRNMQ